MEYIVLFFRDFFSLLSNNMKRIGHDYLYLAFLYLYKGIRPTYLIFIVHSKALKKAKKRGRLKSKKRILALYSVL